MSAVNTLISQKDGKITGVNAERLTRLPYFLLTNPDNETVSIPALGVVTPPPLMSISGQGPAVITSLMCQSSALFTITLQIEDGQAAKSLMNTGIHSSTLFPEMGVGGVLDFKPYKLPEALYLDEGRSIVAYMTNISPVTNNIRLGMMAERLLRPMSAEASMEEDTRRENEKASLSLPFWYGFEGTSVSLAGNATSNQVINISQEAHFQLFQISYVSTSNFLINIKDATTGESVFSAPLGNNFSNNSRAVLGDGHFPMRFHQPRLFKAGQKLVVTVTDTSGNLNVIYLTLGGRALSKKMWR